MNRFFVETSQIFDKNIEIIGQDVKHIRDVLRLRENEQIEVVCSNKVYISKIISIDKKMVQAEILSVEDGKNEPPIEINLFQGLAKGSKMDVIVQKCIEVGVRRIYPVLTERSIVKINNLKKEESKVERWNMIADGAAKQSKRDIIPTVESILTFDEMLEILKDEESILVPYEDENQLGIKEVLKNQQAKKINIIIGPEGGFDTKEIERLKNMGASIVSLGPRILRTETAGIVTSSVILYELGDLGVIL